MSLQQHLVGSSHQGALDMGKDMQHLVTSCDRGVSEASTEVQCVVVSSDQEKVEKEEALKVEEAFNSKAFKP